MPNRLLAIVLDGHEPSLAEAMMADGELPAIAALKERSRRWSLDHGPAKRTGLAGEHLATGRGPAKSQRWSAVHFDKATYAIQQQPTIQPPFLTHLDVRATVFDAPYFDLRQAATASGLVAFGAHDPGVPSHSRPDGLTEEVTARFGPYPAKPWIYGFAWPSVEKCRTMGEKLTEAVEQRREIALWLLRERLPDWELGLVVVSEMHSAIEGLWHGVDSDHPLHGHPSQQAAGDSLRSVMRAVDRLAGSLVEAFPDDSVAILTPHGMGRNNSDAASMFLLAETMYRYCLKRPAWSAPPHWTVGEEPPMLDADESWERAVGGRLALPRSFWRRLFPRRLAEPKSGPGRIALTWMPTTQYRAAWPDMDAFALPSFYDGQIRLNVRGREAHGTVAPANYERTCAEIECFLRELRDPRTGEAVVSDVVHSPGDPLDRHPTACDLTAVWQGTPLAIAHPRIGTVGPVPFRRSGGHTGGDGFLWLSGAGIRPSEGPRASTFDVVPTLIELLGRDVPAGLSGRSLLDGLAVAAE